MREEQFVMAGICDASKRQIRRNTIKVVLLFAWLLAPFVCLIPGGWNNLFWWCWIFISGLLLIGGTLARYIRARQMLSWISTEGTVEAFSIHPPGFGRLEAQSYPGPMASMRYEYTLNGQTYIGGDVVTGNRATSLAASYPPGSRVIVFYDPRKPWRSTTISLRGVPRGSLGAFLLGIIIVVFCIAALWA